MTPEALETVTDELRDLIADRLNVRARSFRAAVRRAGRLLPAPARAAAAEIAAAEARMAHPKLAARTDPALVNRAAETIRTALADHKPGALRARDRSILLAEIGFKIAVLIALGLAYLHWQSGV